MLLWMIALCMGFSGCKQWFSHERRYELEGRVISVDKYKSQATIAHKEIKGYMPAMAMPFTIKDDWAVGILAPGDQVKAALVVDDSSSWLEELTITQEGNGQANTTAGEGFHEPQIGQVVPDFTLLNQDSKKINLREYRGKALVLTFIYTRCPLPDYCPLMSANFAAIDKELRSDAELYAKTHLLSVSFDPEYDTPRVLRSYGAAYTERYSDETFDHWEFATGTPDEIKQITGFFGLRYWKDPTQIVHGLRTAVIGRDGKLRKFYHGNEWKPADIISDLKDAAQH